MFMPWCCRRDKVIVRVHPVYLMNIARRQKAAKWLHAHPQTESNNLAESPTV